MVTLSRWTGFSFCCVRAGAVAEKQARRRAADGVGQRRVAYSGGGGWPTHGRRRGLCGKGQRGRRRAAVGGEAWRGREAIHARAILNSTGG